MHLHFPVVVCVFVLVLNDPPEKHRGVFLVLMESEYEKFLSHLFYDADVRCLLTTAAFNVCEN